MTCWDVSGAQTEKRERKMTKVKIPGITGSCSITSSTTGWSGGSPRGKMSLTASLRKVRSYAVYWMRYQRNWTYPLRDRLTVRPQRLMNSWKCLGLNKMLRLDYCEVNVREPEETGGRSRWEDQEAHRRRFNIYRKGKRKHEAKNSKKLEKKYCLVSMKG